MSDSPIGVVDQTAAGASNTKSVDAQVLITPAGATVYRQTVTISDPTSAIVAGAPVDNVLGLTIYDSTQLIGVLNDIKRELQNMARLLGGQPATEA